MDKLKDTLVDAQELIYKTDIKIYKTFHLNVDDIKITLKPVKKSILL